MVASLVLSEWKIVRKHDVIEDGSFLSLFSDSKQKNNQELLRHNMIKNEYKLQIILRVALVFSTNLNPI